ncbi:hypothetical protein QWZ13_19265 [Reinekea marina]|nr:hypothetical protein [Reinekea marina]MDN3647299.1 hypothetical protein [Reinekea marina]MDN3651055.1 hypothetical protein [Reinekea marina]
MKVYQSYNWQGVNFCKFFEQTGRSPHQEKGECCDQVTIGNISRRVK